jgi:hypothetical protein
MLSMASGPLMARMRSPGRTAEQSACRVRSETAGLPLKPRFWPVPEIGLRSEMVHLVASNSGRPVGARSQHSPGVGSTQTKLHARRAAYILLTDRLFFTFQGDT